MELSRAQEEPRVPVFAKFISCATGSEAGLGWPVSLPTWPYDAGRWLRKVARR
jgi:hypothetical protein